MDSEIWSQIIGGGVATIYAAALLLFFVRLPVIRDMVTAWTSGQKEREQMRLDAERYRSDRLSATNEAILTAMQSIQSTTQERDKLNREYQRALLERVDSMGVAHKEQVEQIRQESEERVAAMRAESEQTIAVLRAELEETRRELASMTARTAAQADELIEMRQQNADLQARLAAVEADRIQTAHERDEARDQVKKLEEEVGDLKRRIEQFRAERMPPEEETTS